MLPRSQNRDLGHPAQASFTGEGKLRSFVNLYLNDEDVRYLPEKERSEVSANDTLSIIPSIAGGGGSI
jgi:adenylyltransferase/sulfurtransferase